MSGDGEKIDGGRPIGLEYVPQLDGLRAAACLAVIFSHVEPSRNPIQAAIPWGALGVQFFFVLSGFLITGILLRGRDALEAGRARLSQLLWTFHARRFLRIFPLYYVTLAVLYFLDYGYMRAAIGWYMAYLMNFWRAMTGISFLNHFWALAVEEQFYLLWPWVVLLTPRRHLVPVIMAVAAVAPVYRTCAYFASAQMPTINALPFGNLDTLGMGALLAVLNHAGERWAPLRRRFSRWGLRFGGAVTAVVLFGTASGLLQGIAWLPPLGTAVALFYVGVIAEAVRGIGGSGGAVLSARPVRYVGRISYGLYVVHPLVFAFLQYLSARYGLPLLQSAWLRFPTVLAGSLLLAAFSWHVMEKPLNELKRFVPYASEAQTASRSARRSV